jgi:hypothetical protein
MSEDHSNNRNPKKKEESKSAPDFFGSSGKGMLAKENLEILGNSPGLTPLSFGVDVRNRILNNSSGLSPLRPSGKNHKKEVLE